MFYSLAEFKLFLYCLTFYLSIDLFVSYLYFRNFSKVIFTKQHLVSSCIKFIIYQKRREFNFYRQFSYLFSFTKITINLNLSPNNLYQREFQAFLVHYFIKTLKETSKLLLAKEGDWE